MKQLKLIHSLFLLGAAAAFSTGCITPPTGPSSAAERPAAPLAPLPETVTSFGAVTCDGWLYVFGGHRGERHEYSAEKVSGSFQRLRLSDGQAWETLPSAAPGQGQPLVAHGGSVYRIGGMAARNRADAPQDLCSLNLVERFDPRRGKWETLPALPAPRSSHDAAVLGNRIYVAGGWVLAGGTNRPVWPATALVLDLADLRAGWREFPQPFRRRALALAAQGTRLYCLGGLDSNNKPTSAVEIYDTTTGQWRQGPAMPTGQHQGFACSAIGQNGHVYANSFQGDLLRLSANGRSWETVGRLQRPRMAHRLVTAGTTQLIALGGEDGEEKRPDLELLTPAADPNVAAARRFSQSSNLP